MYSQQFVQANVLQLKPSRKAAERFPPAAGNGTKYVRGDLT